MSNTNDAAVSDVSHAQGPGDLPVVKDLTLAQTSACGDVLTWSGDVLTIDAYAPLADMVPAKHRKPTLLVDGIRWTLLTAEPKQSGRVAYTFERERETLYEIAGEAISYDSERHLALKRARAITASAWALYLVLLPLMPFLGFLPHDVKAKLQHVGIEPATSTGASMAIEYLLSWATAAIFLLTIIGEASLPMIGLAGAVALTVIADLTWRWSGMLDDPPKHGAMFGVIPAFGRAVVRIARDVKNAKDPNAQ